MIQIRSVDDPFTSHSLYRAAVSALKLAEAMGLLPEQEVIARLDREIATQLLDRIARAGIGRGLQAELKSPRHQDPESLEKLFERLAAALEESPAPAYEWPRLAEILGVDQLARLLQVSPSSVRRYKESARTTPDDVAARLHFIALVVGDLAGAYNDIGIRRWFERRRALLGDRAPAELLNQGWGPSDPGPARVRELARSLLASPAT
jgi:hypothetical protein